MKHRSSNSDAFKLSKSEATSHAGRDIMSTRPARYFVIVLAFLGLLGMSSSAQPKHPIYLQYDGFIQNQDASFTLAFGYHNLNQVDVTIELGDNNSFLGSVPDRAQPTMFLVGRHRFACVMIVPKNFKGDLRWQISFAGVTSTTTNLMLDVQYSMLPKDFDENALNLIKSIDPKKETPGICLEPDKT